MYRRRTLTAILTIAGLALGTASALSAEPSPPSPTGAVLRSLVFPGWGQLYNGKPMKAVVYAGIEQALIYGIYRQHKLLQFSRREGLERDADFYRNDRNRFTWYLAGAVILSMVDAYVDAHLWDFEVGGDAALGAAPIRGGGQAFLTVRF